MQERKYGYIGTYGRGLERLLVHTYGQGLCTWLGRNGETASSVCSCGANRLGQNGMCHRVHREGLDGIADGNEAWRTAKRRKRPCVRSAMFETGSCSSGGVWRTAKWRKKFSWTSYGGNGVLLIERGVAYRKMEETDLCWTSYGRNGVLLIRRGVAYHKTRKLTSLRPPTVETGVLFIGRAVAYRKTGIHRLLFIHCLLPRSSLHGLLFIHRRPPPASTCDCSSMVSPSCLH